MSLWTQSSMQEAFDERLGQAWGERHYSSKPGNRFIMTTWPQKVKEQNLTHSGISPHMLRFIQSAFQKEFRSIFMTQHFVSMQQQYHRWWIMASAMLSTYYDVSLNSKCQPHGGTRGKYWPTRISSSHLANVAKGSQNVTNQQQTLSECLNLKDFTTLKWDVGQFKHRFIWSSSAYSALCELFCCSCNTVLSVETV